MTKLVALQYQFMFSPSETWPHLYEFEKSLFDFFAAHGMEAEIIEPIKGLSAGRILLIAKIQEVPVAKVEKPKTPKEQLKKLR